VGWWVEVVHSVELLFDADTETAIRRQWEALAAAGLPSAAHNPSKANRPHVSLAVAERIDAGADDALAALAGLPVDCRVGAPMLFGSRSLILVRLIVPSAALLALHREVDAVCLPHMTPGPMPNGRPGNWTPHVTLCRRLAPADVGKAIAAIRSRDIDGSFTGLRHWDGAAKRVVSLQQIGPGTP